MTRHETDSIRAGCGLKVLMCTNSVAIGGMEQHVLSLAHGLMRLGCSVSAVVPSAREVRPFVHLLNEARVPVRLLDLHASQPRLTLARKWSDFVRFLRAEQFAVFHQHRTGPYHGKWACLAAKSARVPSILATEHLPAYPLAGVQRVMNQAADAAVDRIITVCELDRTRQLDVTWRSARKLVTIHNGIDTTPFALPEEARVAWRKELGLEGSWPVIGVLARLVPAKGVGHLLKALPRLAERWPKMVLLVGGEGHLRADLESECHRLAIADRVRFLGQRRDTPQFLAGIDLFVLPSEVESFPIVLLEAMAAGKAIVASNVGGVSESVRDGVNGYVVQPKDPRALAEAIERSLVDKARLAEMGGAGRVLVASNYTREQMAAKTVALYRSLLV